MNITSRKLSDLLPRSLRPFATRLGLERTRIRLAAREALLQARLRRGEAVTHLHGPTRIELGPEQLVVLCLVRNGAPWLQTFIRHHRQLGAEHIVFLDNGSTDGTLDIATSHDCVSVFSTSLPFAENSIALKRWMVKRFGSGGWSLYCDADELFDYPFSGSLELSSFLRYLNHRGYTAVTAQMLDMFSDEPLAAIQDRAEEDLKGVYRFYDIADLVKTKDKFWTWMNRLDSETLFSHTGGIRASAFGWDGSMLTKHPLVRYDGKMNVFAYDHHFVTNASIADVTGVLLHYKFTGSFVELTRDNVRRGQHHNRSRIYQRYQQVLESDPGLSLRGPGAREYRRPEELLDSGFLVASEAYRKWVQKWGRGVAANGG